MHPFLFATIPVLALWVQNLREGVTLDEVVTPLAITVGATGLVMAGATMLLRRDVQRGALAAAATVFLVFSYGPVFFFLGGVRVAGVAIAPAPAIVALCVALFALAVIRIIRAGRARVDGLTRGLNLVAAGLVAVNIGAIAAHEFRGPDVGADPSDVLRAAGRAPDPAAKPDIYFIVLDDYGGERALRELLGFDNRPFLNALEQRGFYVPAHPTTNYPHTSYFLASALNLKYVQDQVPPGTALGVGTLRSLITDDVVPKFLKAKGYRYVHIGSWAKDTATNPQADANVVLGGGLSEFSKALLGQTVLEPAFQEIGTLDWDRQQYHRALFQFDQLAKGGGGPRPRFVFGHILVPHWPYVFDQDGRFSDARIRASSLKLPLEEIDPDIRARYIRQLQFANARTLNLIDRLLAGPPEADPVIVLQSDEGFFTWLTGGPEVDDRELLQHFNVLSAYYLPHLEHPALYPEITPVNTFRLLFDEYFHAGLGLLPDRNFVLAQNRGGYRFADVTQRVRSTLSDV